MKSSSVHSLASMCQEWDRAPGENSSPVKEPWHLSCPRWCLQGSNPLYILKPISLLLSSDIFMQTIHYRSRGGLLWLAPSLTPWNCAFFLLLLKGNHFYLHVQPSLGELEVEFSDRISFYYSKEAETWAQKGRENLKSQFVPFLHFSYFMYVFYARYVCACQMYRHSHGSCDHSAGNGIRGLMHIRQLLYHWATPHRICCVLGVLGSHCLSHKAHPLTRVSPTVRWGTCSSPSRSHWVYPTWEEIDCIFIDVSLVFTKDFHCNLAWNLSLSLSINIYLILV